MSACPDDQRLAAFAEGALAPADRESVEAHVSHCARCLDLVAAVGRLHAEPLPQPDPALIARVTGRRAARWPGHAFQGIAAAAVLVMAAVVWPGRHASIAPATHAPAAAQPSAGIDSSRAQTPGIVEVEEPVDGALVGPRPQVRWTGPADAAWFEVQVATPSGDVQWTRHVDGSARAITLDAALPPGTDYYLWVAAYLPEGRRVASGVIRIRTSNVP